VTQLLELAPGVVVEAGGSGVDIVGPVVDLAGELRDTLRGVMAVEQLPPLFHVGQQDRMRQGHRAHWWGVRSTVLVQQGSTPLLGHLRQQARSPVDDHDEVLQG